jgi:hypothetical protein
MSLDNLLWGAPRIHGELLKLGFEVAQSTVASNLPAQPCTEYRRVRSRSATPSVYSISAIAFDTAGWDSANFAAASHAARLRHGRQNAQLANRIELPARAFSSWQAWRAPLVPLPYTSTPFLEPA